MESSLLQRRLDWVNSVAQNEPTDEEFALELLKRRAAREHFVDYVEYVSRTKAPRHSRLLCTYLDKCCWREITRLMVFMPPGHAKSFYISRHFGAYYLSKFPDHSIIAATHTEDFSNTWGKRVRNLIGTKEHQLLFPGIAVSDDSRASGRWELTSGAEYNSAGVGGNITGRRSNLSLIDDPIASAEDADSPAVRDSLWDWYGSDLYPRLKKDAVVIIVQTRWSQDDLAGRLLAAEKQGGEKWTVISLPAIAEKNDQLGRKEGEALWPEEYPLERLKTIRAQPSTTARRWSALYQQNPITDTGNIIKRQWVRVWDQKEPPKCHFIIQSWDTAITAKDKSAFSVCLTFGVFKEEKTDIPSIILLSRYRERIEYPELRKMAQRLAVNYLDDSREHPMDGHKKKLPPDMVLIESKATGEPLIADLSRAGIVATRFNPARYGDKTGRLMLCTDIFENGRFYVPGQPPHYTMPRRWADDYINSLIAFPASASRDDADATSQAILRIKSSGWVKNSLDFVEEKPFRVGGNHRSEPLYG